MAVLLRFRTTAPFWSGNALLTERKLKIPSADHPLQQLQDIPGKFGEAARVVPGRGRRPKAACIAREDGRKRPFRARNPVIAIGEYWIPGSPPLRFGAPE